MDIQKNGALFENRRAFAAASPEERINTALRHAAELIRYKGEYIGVRQMRTHMAWYVKGVKGASSVRDKINHAENYEQIAEILNGIEY